VARIKTRHPEETLPLHSGHHVADAAPGIGPAVQELQLRLARLEGEEAEGGVEEGSPIVQAGDLVGRQCPVCAHASSRRAGRRNSVGRA
jgi:hypothetical protein